MQLICIENFLGMVISMKSTFAEKLSCLRREKGLSQRRAATELGISQALLSHYENDTREPKLEFVVKACNYYSVASDYLLGLTDVRIQQALPTPRDCEGSPRLIAAARAVFNTLDGISDPELYSAAVDFLLIPIENVANLLYEPNAQYDPSRDAELKMAEAVFLTRLRRG